MYLVIYKHKFLYETENICRIFCPQMDIKLVYDEGEVLGKDYALTALNISEKGSIFVYAKVSINSKVSQKQKELPKDADEKAKELALADCLFSAFLSLGFDLPPWGMLTGVRPTKLMRTLVRDEGEEGARLYFKEKLHVSNEKTDLALDIVKRQEKIISKMAPKSFSLYVSIPFCPTRCSYCSFVSHSIASAKKLMPAYVELLCKEIDITAKIAKMCGLRLETIYFGGGTPTALSAHDLKQITGAIAKSFDLTHLKEYTVEAGRPDTITKEKLKVLKDAGVCRISINPQTFNNEVLELIGRKHTVKQTLDAFYLAREMGFNIINMDFIAGLPGDSLASFSAGIAKAIELGSENITVHTLSFKRSSKLVVENKLDTAFDNTKDQVEISRKMLEESGYLPYYMYRQSKTLGNLENIGYTKDGFDCLYNIFMMEELHSVLAVGAGGVTKLKAENSSYLERIFNFKYPYEYIDRFKDIELRKEKIKDFYKENL